MTKTLDASDLATAAKTVLIVDDDDGLRCLIIEDVEAMGFTAYGVASVEEAKARIGRGGIDIVLTDLQMPGESGLDLVRWIFAQTHPHPRTIALSGGVDRETRRAVLELGVPVILEKPYSLEALTAALGSRLRTPA